MNLSYLAGVLNGDGWASPLTLGLRVADLDFSEAFARAVNEEFGLALQPKKDERGYWLIRTSNKTGKFNHIKPFIPICQEGKAQWVKGLFDSEGNALCTKVKKYPNSFDRRIAIYSTNRETISTAQSFLNSFGIVTMVYTPKASSAHLGTKQVYELKLQGSKENFSLFLAHIGTSILRKRETIEQIISSYCADITQNRKDGQAKGVAARRANVEASVVPHVLAEVKKLIGLGIKPTQSTCNAIKGYYSMLSRMKHSEIVALARKD